MNRARAIINDMQISTAGQILTDGAPFTVDYLNEAIEEVQEYLALNGVTSNLIDNFDLTPITPVATQDPSVQVFISTDGYFDGVEMNATPALPPNILVALKCWQRQTGGGQWFQEFGEPQDGLCSYIPGPYFSRWEWRQDRINLNGATNTLDIRLRYEASIGEVADDSDFSDTTILIRNGKRALAYMVAAVYGDARGSAQAPAMRQLAQTQMDRLVNRYVRRDQRIAYRRGSYSSGDTIDGSLSGSYS